MRLCSVMDFTFIMVRVVFARFLFFISLNMVLLMVFHLLSFCLPVPTVELGFGYEIDDSLADKIQNTGVIESDGQEQIHSGDSCNEKRASINIEDSSQHSQQTADSDILEPPQPQGWSSF